MRRLHCVKCDRNRGKNEVSTLEYTVCVCVKKRVRERAKNQQQSAVTVVLSEIAICACARNVYQRKTEESQTNDSAHL